MSQSPLSTEQNPDVLLVQRTVAGDKRAYGLLVLKYQRLIQRLIGRMVRDVDLVEDIAQETFIRACKALFFPMGWLPFRYLRSRLPNVTMFMKASPIWGAQHTR